MTKSLLYFLIFSIFLLLRSDCSYEGMGLTKDENAIIFEFIENFHMILETMKKLVFYDIPSDSGKFPLKGELTLKNIELQEFKLSNPLEENMFNCEFKDKTVALRSNDEMETQLQGHLILNWEFTKNNQVLYLGQYEATVYSTKFSLFEKFTHKSTEVEFSLDFNWDLKDPSIKGFGTNFIGTAVSDQVKAKLFPKITFELNRYNDILKRFSSHVYRYEYMRISTHLIPSPKELLLSNTLGTTEITSNTLNFLYKTQIQIVHSTAPAIILDLKFRAEAESPSCDYLLQIGVKCLLESINFVSNTSPFEITVPSSTTNPPLSINLLSTVLPELTNFYPSDALLQLKCTPEEEFATQNPDNELFIDLKFDCDVGLADDANVSVFGVQVNVGALYHFYEHQEDRSNEVKLDLYKWRLNTIQLSHGGFSIHPSAVELFTQIAGDAVKGLGSRLISQFIVLPPDTDLTLKEGIDFDHNGVSFCYRPN